ncbi:MAG: translation initiation factor IF-2 [Muribaculaceae bacterium]|nr:translation initiation factor IF-2 [Muribaculaceae bacterium]
MRTKLGKIAKDLNVGIGTAAELLRKHNIEVADDPNIRIDEHAIEILTRAFRTDKNAKEQATDQAVQRREDKKTARQEREKAAEARRTVGPRIVGQIDLKTGKPIERKPEATVAEGSVPESAPQATAQTEQKPTPKPEQKSEPRPETKPQPKPEAAQMQTDRKVTESAPKPAAPRQEGKPRQESRPEPKPQSRPEKAHDQRKADHEPKRKPEVEVTETNGVYRVKTVAEAPKIKVLGTIDLDTLNQNTRPKKKSRGDRNRGGQGGGGNAQGASGGDRRRRNRIGKEKVDIDKAAAHGTNQRPEKQSVKSGGKSGQQSDPNHEGRNRGKKRGEGKREPQRQEVSAEDVQKQVKETLARLTNKQTKKAVKWRKEKRDEFHNREEAAAAAAAAESKVLKLTEFVTANDLAQMMDVPVNNVIATCMSLGVMVSINQRLDAETINIVAEEFGFSTEYVSAEVTNAIATEEDSEEDLVPRPPIVTVMGHVDHGKTSLLDYIRNANVIAGEAGGITQHIGAYNVKLADGRHITFLDTPGHEAFTAMRARGAKITDLAIIIVAADDDVMPQTIEAINHATAAGVPMVFAINKIDKPTANPDNIKQQLAGMNYLVEEWGGKYQSQDISAKKGIGVDELMEKVLLEAELLDLKANPNRRAVGSIIESSLDKGRGYVATVMVQNGTLRVGDVLLAGTHHGKIKAMFNERNQRVKEAGPSTPVLILGLNGAPAAGDTFNVLETEQEAREIAAKREQLQRELGLRTTKRLGLEELGRRRALNDFHELNLVVKGDVDGSIEALSDSLIKLSTPEIQVNVLHKGVGAISESDVTLAAASDAIIIGFQVRPSGAARKEAEKEGVEIRLYSVIYKAIEEVKQAMEGLLAPEIKEEITGTAEVLQTYHISKVGTIAGAIVRDGRIKSRSKIRVIRDGIVVYTGELGSLKRFKDDVKEVVSGYDCGLSVSGYNDIREGDLIEGYEEVEVKKKL